MKDKVKRVLNLNRSYFLIRWEKMINEFFIPIEIKPINKLFFGLLTINIMTIRRNGSML